MKRDTNPEKTQDGNVIIEKDFGSIFKSRQSFPDALRRSSRKTYIMESIFN